MRLIVGLGNPGSEFERTRHNVGFWCVEQFAIAHELQMSLKSKYRARLAVYGSGDTKVIVAEPVTYYNLSGEAVRTIADFYRIAPHDILLVHDDMSLPFGTIRTRRGGSDAGNNGVKSVTEHIGPDTARLRIGTATALREHMDGADFVLSKFSPDELGALADLLPSLHDAIDRFVSGHFDSTTHRSPSP